MLKAFSKTAARMAATATGVAALACAVAALEPREAEAQATTHEVTVTVIRFKALDKADELSAGDFFVRMSAGGKAAFSPVLSGQNEFKPNWKLTLPIAAGKQSIKLALIDKDVTVDDPVDINRMANKRDLDFTVDTKTGRIDGFAQPYKVGQTITRAGTETKKADISFKVDVKKK